MSTVSSNDGYSGSRFTQKIAERCPVAASPGRDGPHTLAMRDQLLVSTHVSELLGPDWIRSRGVPGVERVTTFRELFTRVRREENGAASAAAPPPEIPGEFDVELYRVAVDEESDDEIFRVTQRLRDDLLGELNHRLVDEFGDRERAAHRFITPNHVLIPSPADSHGCPWGPPQPADPPTDPGLERTGDPVDVTVIDSGFQWDPAWGENPLEPVHVDVLQAWGLHGQPDIADVPDVDGDGLDVLAGHANFIAGVVAQNSPNARVTIRNHNGGFAPASDNLSTEMTVACSMMLSTGASVINVGFAFLTSGVLPSYVWDLALGALGSDVMVVVPAGNQDSTAPHYPAALRDSYANVVSVGSIDDGTPIKRSKFSNHGPWVTCWARGSEVVSTFLGIPAIEVEDGPPGVVFDFSSGWAKWNGTSFAAPKVAARIAQRMADASESAPTAWAWLLANEAQTHPSLGPVFV